MKEQRKKKWLLAVCMLLVSAILIIVYRAGLGKKNTSDETGQSDTTYSFAMGTSVSVTLFGADREAYTDLESEVKRLDTEIVSWRAEGSALYKLNHT